MVTTHHLFITYNMLILFIIYPYLYSVCAHLPNSFLPPYTENKQGSNIACEYSDFPKFIFKSHDIVQSLIKLKLFHFLLDNDLLYFCPLQHLFYQEHLVLLGAFTVKADGFRTDCPSHFIFTYKGSILGDGTMLYNTNSALHLQLLNTQQAPHHTDICSPVKAPV